MARCVRIASRGAVALPHTRSFLTYESLNPSLRSAAYAVRGEIVIRAAAIAAELKAGSVKHPFKDIVYCNIGNPQELGQAPLTFPRAVSALLNYPPLFSAVKDKGEVSSIFPADAVARAAAYYAAIPGGIGAYSNSQGIEIIRKEVADFISARDGYIANPKDIFLTDGASPAVQMLIRAMINAPEDAIMIPIPQYPLYSASLALYGGSQVGYLLDEATNWSLQVCMHTAHVPLW